MQASSMNLERKFQSGERKQEKVGSYMRPFSSSGRYVVVVTYIAAAKLGIFFGLRDGVAKKRG